MMAELPTLTTCSFGIQAYWGGLAASVVLSSIFPSFHEMANTLPASAEITTQQLIGFVMYGKLIWNPISVLQFLLEDDYNASIRAGCFFAGMGFFISQVATNLLERPLYICQSRRWHCSGRHFAQQLNML